LKSLEFLCIHTSVLRTFFRAFSKRKTGSMASTPHLLFP
jgi:hypothetical protein